MRRDEQLIMKSPIALDGSGSRLVSSCVSGGISKVQPIPSSSPGFHESLGVSIYSNVVEVVDSSWDMDTLLPSY